MSFTVEPGASFYVEYVADGIQEDFPVPDLTAQTNNVIVALNGIIQPPIVAYTVHQGNMRFTADPVPANYVVSIRS